MSRENKFRAWNKESKQYVPPMTIEEMIYSTKNGFSLEQLNEWFIFEQYTGLKDMNGVDIYEGDIIKVSNEIDEVYEKIGVVIFCFDEMGYKIRIDKSNIVYLINNEVYSSDVNYEVIGNIHENKEMLK